MTALQYIRRCNLVVNDDAGNAIDLSELRITFNISRAAVQFPNVLVAKVYNLSTETANRIQQEFTQVRLDAGYEQNYGSVFTGTVRQLFTGRDNGTDTYLCIVASDGDLALNFATVATTIGAGATQRDQINASLKSMQDKGVGAGYIADMPTEKLPRGKVMLGMARDYMRQTTQTTDTSWSIQDGKVQVVPLTGVLPNEVVELNSKSGMVGQPEQTNQGINVKCLINPTFKVDGRVKINQQDVQRAVIDVNATFGSANIPAKISDDGLYRILSVEHSGDTRGQEWYTKLICVDVDDTSPIRGSVRL